MILPSAWLLVIVITSCAHARGVSGQMTDSVAPVAGIVTLLVNVRVGLGWGWVKVEPSTSSIPDVLGNVADLERRGTNETLTSGVMVSERDL